MELPYYSFEELWRNLGGENISFFTWTTANKIPNKPGIYAFFYPFDVNYDLSKAIKSLKEIYMYDSTGGLHKGWTNNFFVKWQSVETNIYLKPEFRQQKTIERKWNKLIKNLPSEDFKSLRQIIRLSSFLAQPLYIGMTKSLSARYEMHINGSNKNDFNKRFESYMKKIGENCKVKDLIFLAMPIDFGSSKYTKEQTEDIIKVIEYILKNIANPIYGER